MLGKIFRKVITIGSGLIIMGLLLPVLYVTAAPRLNQQSATTTRTAGQTLAKAFCQRLTNFSDRITERFTEQQSKLQQKRQERLDNITKHRQTIDQKLVQQRARWAENKENQLTKLEDRATTTEQQIAVKAFKERV
jgi:glycogen debranching enzyme